MTPKVKTQQFYKFGIAQRKYSLRVVANGTALDSNRVVQGADFCVGQYMTFWLKSSPPYVSSIFNWSLAGVFENAETNPCPTCSTDPYVDQGLLAQPSTTAWWVSGGSPETYNSTVQATFIFANGQSITASEAGQFHMFRPQATVTTITGDVGFGYNYYLRPANANVCPSFWRQCEFPPNFYSWHSISELRDGSSIFSGTIGWLQVVDSTTRRVPTNDPSGKWFGLVLSDVLDNPAQFRGNAPTVPYDSPSLQPSPYPLAHTRHI